MKNLLILVLFLFIGCTYPISEVDVSGADPACVKECTKSYSECVQGAPAIGAPTMILEACRESFRICVDTCPAKE